MDSLVWSKHAETDNAYVGADVAQVTSQLAAPVSAVLVEDTQQVHRGDVLVRLDDTDAKIAVANAQANLATAIRKVQGLHATDSGLGAQIAARAADQGKASAVVAAAQADLDKARIDLQRRQGVASTGAVSQDELTTVRTAYSNAAAALRAAQASQAQAAAARMAAVGDRDANRALIANATVDNNPEVLAARAALQQAQVDLERTVIRAPIDGVVSRRQVQVGQRVQPGSQLMTVVPVQAAYVDANFKEVELKKVKPGQPVELTADLYGEDVVFHGTVSGFLRRHGRSLRAGPGAERHRQLDQGGAAPAGPHPTRSQGTRRAPAARRPLDERRRRRLQIRTNQPCRPLQQLQLACGRKELRRRSPDCRCTSRRS